MCAPFLFEENALKPVTLTKQLTALDRDGICAAQQRVGAGALTINGALAASGVATLDTQRIVGIYSAGNLSARVFTVTGTDENGIPISETITGPNATTVSGVLNFKTVTAVSVDATIATDAEVGTTGVGATPIVMIEQHISPANVGLFVEIAAAATVNVTVQNTPDNIFDLSLVNQAALGVPGINWTDDVILAAIAASAASNLAVPVAGVRLVVNSGTDAVKLIVRQAGLQ